MFNIMTGDPTTILRFDDLTPDSCKALCQQCIAAAWTRAPAPVQSRLNFAPDSQYDHAAAPTSHEGYPPIQRRLTGCDVNASDKTTVDNEDHPSNDDSDGFDSGANFITNEDEIVDIDDSHSSDDPPVFVQCSQDSPLVECFVCTECNPK